MYRMAADAMKVLETALDADRLHATELDRDTRSTQHQRAETTHHDADVRSAMQSARQEIKARLPHGDRSRWLEPREIAKADDRFVPSRLARSVQAFQAPTTTMPVFALSNRSATYLGCVAAMPGHLSGTARDCTCAFCKKRSTKN